ncbi:MAG: hypothetical protein ACLUVA_09115 [Faecalibacterium sp.]
MWKKEKDVPFTPCQEETDERKSGKDSLQLAENAEYSWKRRKIYLQNRSCFAVCLSYGQRLLPSETGQCPRGASRRERMGLVAQTTKRALRASLKKLLVQKPLNKITINDIAEGTAVSTG